MILALAYLLLVIRQNIWCWLCAGVSSAIYVWLFMAAKLLMLSMLSIFYIAMAVYGWIVWRRSEKDAAAMPVRVWSLRIHIIAITVILALTAGSGWLLSRYSDDAYPFVDSLLTFAAIWAAFLVTRKVLENWWYWLLIDAVSVVIYWSRDLELTALLFVGYVILIPIGMAQWMRTYRLQTAA